MEQIAPNSPPESASAQDKTMQPLQDLLHRIRWDPVFGRDDFTLAYYDRVAKAEQTVTLADISFDPERPRTFSLRGTDGLVHNIPLHRVRSVSRDGRVIWQRPVRA
jgi:uncharacterized protein (UPF0248 family)